MNTKALRQKILDLAIHGKLVRNEKKTFIAGSGYVRHLRIKLLEKLKPQLGKIKNIKTGIVANLSKKSVDKMTSAKALEKSKSNGFSVNEHFEIAEQIKPLYENAELAFEHGNLKNPKDPNVISIKRFVVGATLKSGTKADVLITVKESLANGNKIYSIELDEINKASEKFGGLCDAAEKSANRATKTPHVDTSNIANSRKKSREDLDIGNEERESNVIASVAKQSIPKGKKRASLSGLPSRKRGLTRYAELDSASIPKGKKRASLSGLTRQSVSEDEIPFELPKGWAWKKGSEIFLPMTSRKPNGTTFRYIDIDSIDNKTHRIRRPKELDVKKAPSRATRELKTGDILFSLVRPYLENIAFIDEKNSDCIASTGFYICRPNNEIFPKYAFFMMTSDYVIKGLNQFMKGDNSPSISGTDIQNWLFPLPPLAEQKLIVAKIEKIFAQIDLLEQNKTDLLTAVKQAKSKILDLAIHGKLVPQNPSDEPASALLKRLATQHNRPYEKMEAPFAIPDSWAWCRLGEIISIISGVSYNKNDVQTNGIRILRGGNIQDGKIILCDDDVFLPKKYKAENNSVKKGDILLVASTGSSLLIGKTGRSEFDYSDTQIGAFLRILRTDINISSDFINIIFLSKYYKDYIRNLAKGTNINNVKTEYLVNFPIPLPPLAEQQRIVSKTEALFSALDQIQSNLV